MTPPLWEGIAPALERLPSSRKSRVCPRSAAGSGCLEAEALAELAPRPPTTMSTFDTNPFADPVDVNPFQDPSVTQLTSAPQGGLAEFNPFSETNAATTVPVTQLPGPSQPAVLQPSVEPTQPSPQAVASAAQASLLRQQEELDRKAAELERKERELQNTVTNLHVRENNWPPLPSFCPIKPCFYQDFSIEIPADYQRICKMLYYLWMLHSVTLFLNLLACLAWFLVDNTKGVDFGLSILWFVMFTPCAFLCWYRPIYKAFRSDNSFSFFVFFFVFFCQIVIYVIQLVGIPNLGDRCTPCTAGQGPASSRPRRSFPRASSATGPSAALPRLLPGEPSRGISPPDSPPSAPAFSLVCLLAALSMGALSSGYAQHRPGESLAMALPPSSATSSPFRPREGE
uniref:Secretory carrier-associated membrane protein n=1 Tax=Equus caballus TaxID=9796 RepID=A0A9L0SU19_HORSE